jgi:hypothetical protein
MTLDQTELKQLLHYDPATGLFAWRVSRRRGAKAGDIAGYIIDTGYRRIHINKRYYLAHRLAFLYMTGSFPPHHTDHINGIRDDNRWENLRGVTTQENGRNAKRPKDNTSGVIGVSWHKQHARWRAHIVINRKHKHLGLFDNLLDAVAARKQAERKYDFHPNHGRVYTQSKEHAA